MALKATFDTTMHSPMAANTQAAGTRTVALSSSKAPNGHRVSLRPCNTLLGLSISDPEWVRCVHAGGEEDKITLETMLLKEHDTCDCLGRTWQMVAAAMGNDHLLGLAKMSCTFNKNCICCDLDGDTAMHHAARNGSANCGKILIELEQRDAITENAGTYTGSMSIRNKDGYTPLGLAAEYGRVNFVQLLLVAGADPNETLSTCMSGNLPVHFACMRGFPRVVRALVQGGANATLKNAKAEAPSDLATCQTKKFLDNPVMADLDALVRGKQYVRQH